MSDHSSLQKTNLSTSLQWPKHLRTPQELIAALRFKTKLRIIKSPLASKLILQFIGSCSYLLAHRLNRCYVENHEVFTDEIRRIEEQNAWSLARKNNRLNPKSTDLTKHSPLITLSNHISCIDDPVLWAILLPHKYYFTQTESVRWVGAAVDICFSKPWHSTFFSLGKTFPIVRGAGLDQPAMDFALALLKHRQWLHLFPEGRVMRDHEQQILSNRSKGYTFKWGISKLILDYFRSSLSSTDATLEQNSEIRILPFYHLGMDSVLPIGPPYIPKSLRHVSIYIRPEVIKLDSQSLTDILRNQSLSWESQKSRSNDEISLIKLTNYLEREMEKLVEPAERFHAICDRKEYRMRWQ